MTNEKKMIRLIEKDIHSFSEVSRFPDASFTDNLQSAVRGSQKSHPAIKISEDDDVLNINCEIIVYFGVNIPQLCYDIQSKVKSHIEQATGKTVRAVNIRVEGIDSRE